MPLVGSRRTQDAPGSEQAKLDQRRAAKQEAGSLTRIRLPVETRNGQLRFHREWYPDPVPCATKVRLALTDGDATGQHRAFATRIGQAGRRDSLAHDIREALLPLELNIRGDAAQASAADDAEQVSSISDVL